MSAREASTFSPQEAAARVFASRSRVVREQVLSAKDLESMGLNFNLSYEQPIPPDKDSLENHFANPLKVEFCHRTNSPINPYNLISADYHSVNGNGDDDNGQGDHALEHTGPVVSSIEEAQQLKDRRRKWGDIIPPDSALGVPGLNWTPEGQAVFEDDCEVNGVELTNTPRPRPPTSTLVNSPTATGTREVVETPTPTRIGTQPPVEKTPTQVWPTPTLGEGGKYESYKTGASYGNKLINIFDESKDEVVFATLGLASLFALKRRKEIKARFEELRYQNKSSRGKGRNNFPR